MKSTNDKFRVVQLRTRTSPEVVTTWPDMDYVNIWTSLLSKDRKAYKVEVISANDPID